jgi:UDP-N-acetylmuramoyl-tripeptide--D-alanyl-D-alanine ligase
MLELGDGEQSAHQQLGHEVAGHEFDFFITVGELAVLSGIAAVESGMEKVQVHCFDQHRPAAEFLKTITRPGDCLLFKGSRGSHMETVLEGLIKTE